MKSILIYTSMKMALMGIISVLVNIAPLLTKRSWNNFEGGKMADCSSRKKGSYLSLNAVI